MLNRQQSILNSDSPEVRNRLTIAQPHDGGLGETRGHTDKLSRLPNWDSLLERSGEGDGRRGSWNSAAKQWIFDRQDGEIFSRACWTPNCTRIVARVFHLKTIEGQRSRCGGQRSECEVKVHSITCRSDSTSSPVGRTRTFPPEVKGCPLNLHSNSLGIFPPSEQKKIT